MFIIFMKSKWVEDKVKNPNEKSYTENVRNFHTYHLIFKKSYGMYQNFYGGNIFIRFLNKIFDLIIEGKSTISFVHQTREMHYNGF